MGRRGEIGDGQRIAVGIAVIVQYLDGERLVLFDRDRIIHRIRRIVLHRRLHQRILLRFLFLRGRGILQLGIQDPEFVNPALQVAHIIFVFAGPTAGAPGPGGSLQDLGHQGGEQNVAGHHAAISEDQQRRGALLDDGAEILEDQPGLAGKGDVQVVADRGDGDVIHAERHFDHLARNYLDGKGLPRCRSRQLDNPFGGSRGFLGNGGHGLTSW